VQEESAAEHSATESTRMRRKYTLVFGAGIQLLAGHPCVVCRGCGAEEGWGDEGGGEAGGDDSGGRQGEEEEEEEEEEDMDEDEDEEGDGAGRRGGRRLREEGEAGTPPQALLYSFCPWGLFGFGMALHVPMGSIAALGCGRLARGSSGACVCRRDTGTAQVHRDFPFAGTAVSTQGLSWDVGAAQVCKDCSGF